MRRSVPHVIKRKSKTEGSTFCVDVTKNGKRTRKYFATRAAASAALRVIKEKLRTEGDKALSVSDSTRIAAVEAEKALAPYPGATIPKAIEFYIAHLEAARKSVTVRHLVDEYLAAKAQNKKLSKVHVDDLRSRYTRFCETFGEHKTRVLTSEEVEQWIWTLPLSEQSKNNFRARLYALFNFAIKKGYMNKGENLCESIDRLKVRGGKIEVFTPGELRAVLEAASPEMLPGIVIGAFAGVRTAERARLTWENMDIKRGFLIVGKENSKTASRRTIKMEPCLQAWLAPFDGRTGPIFQGSDVKFCQQLSRVCKAAGLKRAPKNGLRHSFASYHVAKYGDAERVRGDMGHATAGLLFSNYRELVRPEEAERYFNLFPPTQAENVVSLSAA